MTESHEMLIVLNGLAENQNYVTQSFDNFKKEVMGALRKISDDHNTIKQELFILRQKENCSQKEQIPNFQTTQPSHEKPSPPPSSAAQPPQPPPPTRSSPAPPPPKPKTSSPKGQSHKSMPKTNLPSVKVSTPLILLIGDSISANVDIGALSNATQAKIITAKAYSSARDTESNRAKQAARFPDSNFTDVVPVELKKEKFQSLILQAGSVDISNLNTKDNPSEYVEYFRQETVKSATNFFAAGVNALTVQPTLTKVVLMKQIARYDPVQVDSLGLKPALSQLFNNTITDLWMQCILKDRIFIGSHNIECTGAIKESRQAGAELCQAQFKLR